MNNKLAFQWPNKYKQKKNCNWTCPVIYTLSWYPNPVLTVFVRKERDCSSGEVTARQWRSNTKTTKTAGWCNSSTSDGNSQASPTG